MRTRTTNRQSIEILNIPLKANRILNIILVGMLLIVFRIWHLSVIQYDDKVIESRKPQRRVFTEPAKRGTIVDRFNIPLAINKMQYNVAIHYSQIKQIPTTVWETQPDGKRTRKFKRKEYITNLSKLLGDELQMDPERIEDLIHSKASFFNQIPFILKEDIEEKQYYKLKMLERDWPGISVTHTPQRYYPKGKIAGDLVGYMGAINSTEYDAVIREIKALDAFIQSTELDEIYAREQITPYNIHTLDEAKERLKELKELSYTLNDLVGKSGIESYFEKSLKGYRGKKSYYSDSRGNFLRELPGGYEPLSGKKHYLTISAELQEYAENLLIENEKIRQTRLSHLGNTKKTILAETEPWIKGGAIVAMDPNTGEVIALASNPRIDPNDFIKSAKPDVMKKRHANINKWLENEHHLADIWNQKKPLEREKYKETRGIYTEKQEMTWPVYLSMVLDPESPILNGIASNGSILEAVLILQSVKKLMPLSPNHSLYSLLNAIFKTDYYTPHGKKFTAEMQADFERDLQLTSNEIKYHKSLLENTLGKVPLIYDQVLTIDLLMLAVDENQFSDKLLKATGSESLSNYKAHAAAIAKIQETTKKMAKEMFHDDDFKKWRVENEKSYLKSKREEEKALQKYAKPYIDYLDAKETELFNDFWNENQWVLMTSFLTGDKPDKDVSLSTDRLASEINLSSYFDFFLTWHKEIQNGAHRQIEWMKDYNLLKNKLTTFSNDLRIEYLKTLRTYQDLNRKLYGKYRSLEKNEENEHLEKHLAKAFYPRYGFGYGRSQGYRQATSQGSIFKLVTAYEALSQKYQILKSEGKSLSDLNPLEMVDHIQQKGDEVFVGYNSAGNLIPRFYKGGRLPKSSSANMGKMDLLRAIELSSNPYFSLLASEVIKSPTDLGLAAKKFSFGSKTGIELPGEIAGKIPSDLETNKTGLYSTAIGQHTLVVTPLQTTVMLSALANGGKVLKPEIISMTTSDSISEGFKVKKTIAESRSQLFLPDPIRKMLLDAMCRVVTRTHDESLRSLKKMYKNQPQAINDYVSLKSQMLGKTSTAESVEHINLDLNHGTNLYTHVWFGSIIYENDVIDKTGQQFIFKDSLGKPELVVVVYLRYGGFGKEAAPLAAQMAQKWREIKNKQMTR